jgi:hypothetical protein
VSLNKIARAIVISAGESIFPQAKSETATSPQSVEKKSLIQLFAAVKIPEEPNLRDSAILL